MTIDKTYPLKIIRKKIVAARTRYYNIFFRIIFIVEFQTILNIALVFDQT